MTSDEVAKIVCDVLFIGEEDLFDGQATDLRDVGLDSVRAVLILDRLKVRDRRGAMEKITESPTLRTFRQLYEMRDGSW
ncbi:acyl carrier protein [Corynebacterium falsenii]|uniref:acyl carrier protein n=1 Tax=Corynebacterium falsenii TaxID=108486 RepID=UPI003FD6AC4B